MARSITYSRDPNTHEVTHVHNIYEGMVVDGQPSGFGRVMAHHVGDGTVENILGWFHNATHMNGRYAYFRDFEFMWAGEVPPGGDPVSPREQPVNPITDDNFDDFVDQDYEQQRAAWAAAAAAMADGFGEIMQMPLDFLWQKYGGNATAANSAVY